VKTASDATAVQIVHSSRKGSRDIEHVGSAHTDVDLELLKAAARQRLHANQDVLDFGDGRPARGELPILSTRSQVLWDVLERAYRTLGLDRACVNDDVFKALVLARLIEPTSKLDTIRVLDEVGIPTPSYRTIVRRLPGYAKPAWRSKIAAACAAHVRLGPATLVLYDVTTLYFETDDADEFRIPGFSKERRLEPQITVGLLTDARGFPLQIGAFEGNKAETKTILPVVQAFQVAHGLPDVTVVADAGMLSEQNLKELEDAGLHFIVGARIPEVPFAVKEWQLAHPGEPIPDGHIFTQPLVMGVKADLRRRTVFYQYSYDRGRRTLKGIDTQVAKAEKAVAGQASVKRNRFVLLTGATKSINRDLEAKARALAGLKGYVTNLDNPTSAFVMGACHQLWQVEKSFRMSKTDLRARPIYHHKKDSIEAHLNVVFAALAIARWLETVTGWSTRKLVKTLRRYHTVQIKAGDHLITAADPIPDETRTALDKILAAATHQLAQVRSKVMVLQWRMRYADHGIVGLDDQARDREQDGGHRVAGIRGPAVASRDVQVLHLVRRPGERRREGHRRLQTTAPASGVPDAPQASRPRLPRTGVASGDGQLRHPQVGRGPRLGHSEPLHQRALHPDVGVVVEPGRGVVRDHRTPSHPPRHLRLRQRPQRQDPRLRQRLERPLPPLHLDQHHRPNPQESQPSNNFKHGPLVQTLRRGHHESGDHPKPKPHIRDQQRLGHQRNQIHQQRRTQNDQRTRRPHSAPRSRGCALR